MTESRDPTRDADRFLDRPTEATLDGNVLPFDDEAEVARQIAAAGPRPEVPAKDLTAITAAARTAWQQGLEEERAQLRGADGEPPPASPVRRPWRQVAALALAASLLAALGLGLFYATMLWMRDDLGAARVAAVRGEAWIGDGEERRPLTSEAVVGWGETVVVSDADDASTVLRLGRGVERGVELRLRSGSRLAILSGEGSEAPFEAFFRSVAELGGAEPPPFHMELTRGALYADTGREAPALPAREGSVQVDTASLLAISTPFGTVRDVGTRFSVHLADGETPALGVRVRSGEVSVDTGGNSLRAPAGEALVIGPDMGVERRAIDAFGEDWSWAVRAAPPFDLEGATLHRFLSWVSVETGWELAYADAATEAAAEEILLHGDLGGLTPDRAPFALLPGAGMSATLEGGVLVVRRTGRTG